MGFIAPYIAIVSVLGVITYIIWRRRSTQKSSISVLSYNSLDRLIEVVLRECTEIIKIDRGLRYNDVEYEASRKTKDTVNEALKRCCYGEEESKKIAMSTIRSIIARQLTTLEQCNNIIDFSNLELLTPEQKFEILIYEVSKKVDEKRTEFEGKVRYVGKNAIKYLDSIYHLSEPKYISEKYPSRREVDYKQVDMMLTEQVSYNSLNYEQALDLLAIFVYQEAKGFNKIETLVSINIDGLELGTVGSIRHKMLNTDPDYVIERSCSIQINAQWVHLSFIDFGSVDEIKRLVTNISNMEGSKALTVKNPLKVIESWNGSRITVIRPDAGITWGLFYRSFSAGIVSINQWLNNPLVKNWEIVDQLLYYLAKSNQNVAFTGAQNTGKTTLMKAYVEYLLDANIRILEMSFELNLNEVYPNRNIFTIKPNAYITSSEAQDILKKTDGFYSSVGEISEDIVAANAIQFSLIASAALIFTHHANDYRGLVEGLTNSLTSSGKFNDGYVAQQNVLDAVKHNVHLNFFGNLRYVDYIEEIVKGDVIVEYPKVKKSRDVVEAIDQSTAMNRENYQRTTDRVRYSRREIIRFNKKTMSYEPNEWYTLERFEKMMSNLSKEDAIGFKEFYKKYWGQ